MFFGIFDEPEDRPVSPAAGVRARTYCNDNVLCILMCKACKVCTKLGILTVLGILTHCVTEARASDYELHYLLSLMTIVRIDDIQFLSEV